MLASRTGDPSPCHAMGTHLGRLVAFASLFLVGCTLGPDFQPPAAPKVSSYTPESLAPTTTSAAVMAGTAQTFQSGGDIPGQWWELFHSPALDALIRQALANNPSLQAAQAALRVAQENSLAQEGSLYPSIDATPSYARRKASGITGGRPSASNVYTLANASVGVSYGVDVFGGIQRAVETTEAQAEYQRFQLEAAYLSLTANLVTAAVQEASLRGQIAATEEIIATESQQLEVVRKQVELGGAAKTDFLAQTATLAQTRATLPPLQKALAQTRNQLTALAGRFPSEEIAQTFDLNALTLPQDLPLSLPSKLVEQRPDVLAATANLHQASAQIGVAIANQFPQFTISADIGRNAASFADLFTGGKNVWGYALNITQPIFHGGELEHKRRAAEATYEQMAAQHQSTVISAFQDVANTLRALQSDAEALRAQLAAERAAYDSLQLSRQQYEAGGISYLTLLNAERTYQQAKISLVQAQAARFADSAALFQALGGGWWNRTDVAAVTAPQQ